MTKEKYLQMCDMLKRDPDPEVMPYDFQDFPYFMQEIFYIVNMLPDRWDPMSGSYLGKDLSLIPYLFDIYEIEDPKDALYMINYIIGENQKLYNSELKAKRDRAKRSKKRK